MVYNTVNNYVIYRFMQPISGWKMVLQAAAFQFNITYVAVPNYVAMMSHDQFFVLCFFSAK